MGIAIIRHTPRAVGLMEIENLFRSTALAVGLKPSASAAKPACAGWSGIITQRPYALVYARRSPHARAGADYFFKDHKPWLRSGKPCGLDYPGAPGIGKGDGHAAPQGLLRAQGGLSPARAESCPKTDDGGCRLSDRDARQLPHWEYESDCTCPRRFNRYENRYTSAWQVRPLL